jgi:hypothetical protein
MRLSVPLAIALVLATAGCSWLLGEEEVDLTEARAFDEYPLYWVGERFEDWDLVHFDVMHGFATFIYGHCEVSGNDGGCSPPLSIQISPLCRHLGVVARAPIWQQRSIRGAPVGTIDSAPVLFTAGAQVKVYRGQGSDPGLARRAIEALRSINDVPPVIGPTGPIPGADPAMLAGDRPCTAATR